jgi:hypothetical protein
MLLPCQEYSKIQMLPSPPTMNTQLVQSLAQVIRSLSPEEQTLLLQLATSDSSPTDSLSQRQAFLNRPLEERRQILAQQAEALISHYQEDPEWRTLMAGDIIDG